MFLFYGQSSQRCLYNVINTAGQTEFLKKQNLPLVSQVPQITPPSIHVILKNDTE